MMGAVTGLGRITQSLAFVQLLERWLLGCKVGSAVGCRKRRSHRVLCVQPLVSQSLVDW